jgi:DNA polymerase-3 subunit gamma/tau
MILIRLCYVSELPPPGDLVRRLSEAGGAPAAAVLPSGGGGGARAVANGAPARMAEPAGEPAARLASFRDVASLISGRREPMLHAHLVHSVHLVRFAPPVIELRPEPDAPRDLAARLAAALTEATGTRWTIALATAEGEPTLAEQGEAADAARRSAAAEHPLVRAILAAFPGARLEAVRDTGADAYGLPSAPAAALLAPDGPDLAGPEFGGPEFAPDDAEPAEGPPDDWEN